MENGTTSSTDQFRPLTKAEEEMVREVWYDDKAKFGRARTYQLVKAKFGDAFTGSQRGIMDYLKKQPAHQKFNRGLRRTEVKPYGNKRRGMLCVDLIDMTTDAYRQYKAILVGVDAYTRYLSAEPLKDKTSAETARALKVMVRKRPKRHFSVCVSDNGPELVAPEFQQALRDLDIPKHVTTQPHSPSQNGIVERANLSLIRLMYQNMEGGDKNWPAMLDQLCSNYNNTTQSSTNQIPAKLEETAEDAEEHVSAGDFISKKLGKRYSGAEGGDLPIGAQVRTKVIDQGRLYKPNRGGFFNSELFTVTAKAKTRWNQLPTYKLRRADGTLVEHNFPRWQLLLVSAGEQGAPDRRRVVPEEPANVISAEDVNAEDGPAAPRRSLRQQGEYEVEYIYGKKKQGKKVLYHTKWFGYPISESTWEPRANLKNAQDAIREYERGL
jgi:transposase InsO family protein